MNGLTVRDLPCFPTMTVAQDPSVSPETIPLTFEPPKVTPNLKSAKVPGKKASSKCIGSMCQLYLTLRNKHDGARRNGPYHVDGH